MTPSKLSRVNAASLVKGVKHLASKEIQRILPGSQGGEKPTLQLYRTDVSTFFTQPQAETQLLYSAENWVRVKVTLETAGPVAIGTNAQISPVLSGKGRLLDTGVEYEIYVARGTTVYVVSEAVNRLSVTIEPIPWMEQISGEIVMTMQSISRAVTQVGNAITAALSGISGKPATPIAPTAPTAPADPGPPRLPRNLVARLTRVTPARKIR